MWVGRTIFESEGPHWLISISFLGLVRRIRRPLKTPLITNGINLHLRTLKTVVDSYGSPMETTNFTFVTTTNAPGLSRQAAKLMRGHVTRINFTKRRERKARRHQARTEEIEPRQSRDEAAVKTKGPSDKSVNRQMSLAFPLAFPTTTSDPCYEEKLCTYIEGLSWLVLFIIEIVSRFRSLAYLDHENYPRNPSEVSWFSLFISEPALAEVSMGICERLWSPDALCRWRSESHWNTAFNIVIERIQAKRAHTDGVLAAVVNMAFGERLVGNEATWNVHIDGVAQIIRDRHARGIFGVPPWLERLLVLYVVNLIILVEPKLIVQ